MWRQRSRQLAILGIALAGLANAVRGQAVNDDKHTITGGQLANMEIATFAGGCFWCTEAVYQQIKGVESVVPGYIGGQLANPSYEQVCTGTTGHAEAVQITYDPKQVSFDKLLEIHWQSHDPTTLNRQGADKGTQYRSAVFYHNDEQKRIAEAQKKKLDDSAIFAGPIVTEITAASKFYPAEKYHVNYFRSNPNQGYCAMIIRPKVEKIKKLFADDLKSPSQP